MSENRGKLLTNLQRNIPTMGLALIMGIVLVGNSFQL